MGKDRQFEWPKPTIDQAINAGMALATHYGKTFGKIDTGIQDEEPELISDRDGEQRLLNLADQIIEGVVNSHV